MTTTARRRILGGLVALAAATAGTTVAVAHAATAGCRVDYSISSQWAGGFGADVTITYLGDPVNGWALTWTYSAGQTITQAWNATATQSGSAVTAKDAGYNAAIATNGTASFGFNGSWTSSNPEPTAFDLNGTACIGATPPSSPSQSTPTSAPTTTPPSSPPPSSPPPDPGTRTVMPFDQAWLFHYGDASGAQAPTYTDTAWRHVDVPHDWSIEGPNPPADPFSQSAQSTGRGGYLPSGIGWYRKHFSLAAVPSTRKVFAEFDGVMANASVYVNGTLIGTHPYGYTSFRYDITTGVKTGGADNVIAVKTDTSQQPAERFYTGAGINRDVRLLTTDPVHIDQWATYVTTPQVSTSAATVHAQTTVVNNGSAAANVSVRGSLKDPAGTALIPVTTAAKNIAAGASAVFTFDVPVSNPRLWDLQSPNLYSLSTGVLVGATAVDDDVTTVGIRSLTFNASTGMSLNGKSVKFQGVALHQDYHALGTAAPQRAMQRRLAELKALGVNAIRTAHDPPSPAFLDLTDRMGFLVLDEFFDVWTGHKYADVGDYATYFNKTASSPTGTPAVPGASGSVPWYQVDATSIVMRDRDHPSVVMWSAGNEIRDSLSTREPLLTRMVSISHTLDPARPVTQALFRPGDSGDITGATRTTVDVFGGNYRPDEVVQAMGTAPARPGLLTEMGTATSNWTTVRNNPGVTGLFVWTGAAYLGEADGLWPNAESSFGLIDGVGTVRVHRLLLADRMGRAGHVASGHRTPITFSISGPGVIAAVDSGSPAQESFRGTRRKAYQGIAYALVRATGAGAISVTASASGLTLGTATLTGTTAPFVPCSGTCN